MKVSAKILDLNDPGAPNITEMHKGVSRGMFLFHFSHSLVLLQEQISKTFMDEVKTVCKMVDVRPLFVKAPESERAPAQNCLN